MEERCGRRCIARRQERPTGAVIELTDDSTGHCEAMRGDGKTGERTVHGDAVAACLAVLQPLLVDGAGEDVADPAQEHKLVLRAGGEHSA